MLMSTCHVLAAGLQVSPVMLNLHRGEQATALWVKNIDDAPLHVQVRVMRWQQADFLDQLTPSRAIIASPPMVEIAGQSRQLIRIIRAKKGDEPGEIAYRLLIDELPSAAQEENRLRFVLHYSIPLFVTAFSMQDTAEQLHWRLQPSAGRVFLEVKNGGNRHAQLAALTYIDAKGNRNTINPGLVGYVLPAATMRWALPVAPGSLTPRGKIEVTVNGTQQRQSIEP